LTTLQSKDNPDFMRCYLIEGESPPQLYDLDGIQKEIRERRDTKGTPKVIIVLYRDSPAKNTPFAQRLFRWLAPEGMFLAWDMPPKKAPY
jgi:hypothetical protein